MNEDHRVPPKSGYVSPLVRIAMWLASLATAIGMGLFFSASTDGGAGITFLVAGLTFFYTLFLLLLCGRVYEYIKGREWRNSRHPWLKLNRQQTRQLNLAAVLFSAAYLLLSEKFGAEWRAMFNPVVAVFFGYYAYYVIVKRLQMRDQRTSHGQ